MPTLDEWRQALMVPRRVTVESSEKLVRQVERQHLSNDQRRARRRQVVLPRKHNLTAVSIFAPKAEIEIIPAYLLLRLGVVTTPAVENLVDISSTWAYFRYLWAFEMPRNANLINRLRLSEEALRIDFHQKALLSDQIGVGISAVLMGTYFNAPQALDVSLALRNPQWGAKKRNNLSPDYLFFDSNQTNLFVVECKGTQTPRSVSLSQLRRGTEQVQSLVFSNRPTPPSYVIATCLRSDGTRVLIIDPPGEDEEKPQSEPAERINEREWRIHDTARFSRATLLMSQAKMLAFAGDDELSEAKIREAELRIPRRRRQLRKPEIVENEFGQFRGVRQPINSRDGMRLSVFQGMARNLHEALAVDDRAQIDDITREFRERTNQSGLNELKQPVAVSIAPASLTVRTVGPDGTILEIQVAAQ